MSITRGGRRQNNPTLGRAHADCDICAAPVLVIEDQKAIASLIAATLAQTYGYATLIAHSFQEAEQHIATHKIYQAISDLNLPDAPNAEIIDLLVQHGIATVALTGAYGAELRKRVLEMGAIDYEPKQNVFSVQYAAEMLHRIRQNHHTRVMVVDDSVSSRSVLKHFLEIMRFQVLEANDGKETLELLSEYEDIKLMLVDFEMPGMNGPELVHEIRKKYSKETMAIIGISGLGAGEISAQFIKSGANDFIKKPFSYEEVLCRVNQNLSVLELIHTNREAAYRDFLTGLHNRRYFFQEGAKLYARRSDEPLLAAMLDIDHFKKVNDTYGHDCGDMVIQDLAEAMLRYFGNNIVARLGGEEFAVIISGMALPEARERFEAMQQEIAATPVRCNDNEIAYTISTGLTNRAGSSIDDFIKAADQLLYKAKSGGRNRVVVDGS